MTIAEEISALRDRIDVAYDHIASKGGTIPAQTDSWNLSTAIDSIPTGGGGQTESTLGISSLYAVMPSQGRTATSFSSPMGGPYKLDLSFLTAITTANTLNSAVGHMCYGVGTGGAADSGTSGEPIYAQMRWMPNISAVDCSNLQTVTGTNAMLGMFCQYVKSSLLSTDRPNGWDGRYTADFSSLRSINGSNALWCFSLRSTPINGWKFPQLSGLSGSYCCYYGMMGSGIHPLGLSALQQINGNYALDYAFYWANTPGDPDLGYVYGDGMEFTSLSSITGSNTFNYAFAETAMRNVSFPKISSLTASYVMQRAFSAGNNPNAALSGVHFPALTSTTGTYTFFQAFYGNKTIRAMEFPALKSVTGTQSFAQTFYNCSTLSSISFPELTSFTTVATSMWNQGMGSATTNAQNWPTCHLYFPKLTTFRQNAANATFSVMSSQGTASNRRKYTVHIGANADDMVYTGGTAAANSLFYNSRGLTAVYLYNCSNITNTYLFSGCSELTEIHLPAAHEATLTASTGYSTHWGRGAGAGTVYFDL